MTEQAKETYRSFCLENPDLPIFMYDWWLDAVCGDKWKVVLSLKKGSIKGFWLYHQTSKFGSDIITMPPLTKFSGLYLLESAVSNPYKRLSEEKNIIEDLLNQLPDYKYLAQNFYYTSNNWIPLFWRNFKQSTYYSYVLDTNPDEEELLSHCKPQLRNQIRNGYKIVSIEEVKESKKLWDLIKKTYSTKGKKIPYSFQFLEKLVSETIKHNKGKVLLGKDQSGQVASACFYVWDNRRYYYLIGASDPELLGTNANSLLLWEGVKDAKSRNLIFDFEGSMVQSIEKFFRSFGALQEPYFSIQHAPSFIWKINNFIKEIK